MGDRPWKWYLAMASEVTHLRLPRQLVESGAPVGTPDGSGVRMRRLGGQPSEWTARAGKLRIRQFSPDFDQEQNLLGEPLSPGLYPQTPGGQSLLSDEQEMHFVKSRAS